MASPKSLDGRTIEIAVCDCMSGMLHWEPWLPYTRLQGEGIGSHIDLLLGLYRYIYRKMKERVTIYLVLIGKIGIFGHRSGLRGAMCCPSTTGEKLLLARAVTGGSNK